MSSMDFIFIHKDSGSTEFKSVGNDKVQIQVGKDFSARYNLNTDSGKQKFFAKMMEAQRGERFDYAKNRRALGDLNSSLRRNGYGSTHRIRFSK